MKGFKKLISLILAIFLLIGIGGEKVKAYDYTNGITVKSSERLNSVGGDWHYYSFTIDNGLYAYCLDSNLDRPKNGTYLRYANVGLSSYQEERIAAVLIAAGNPGDWGSEMRRNDGSYMSNGEAFYITQAAVWYARYASNGSYNFHTKSGDNYKAGLIGDSGRIAKSNLSNAFNYLKSVADNPSMVLGNSRGSGSITVYGSNSLSLVGNIMLSDSDFTVYTPNNGDYYVTVNGYNAYITNSDGTVNYGTSHRFSAYDTFRIAVSGMDPNQSGSASASMTIETVDAYANGYELYTFSPSNTSLQSLVVADSSYTRLSERYDLYGSYEKRIYEYEVPVAKVNEKNELIPGATLGIFNTNGELLKQVTSTTEYIKVKLNPGKYYLQEIDAPTGYLINDEKIYFSVSEDSYIRNNEGVAVNAITLTDKLPTIKVRKVNQNSVGVTGATIVACGYDVNTKEKTNCTEWITDGTEKVLTLGTDLGTIKDGSYIIYEKEAPQGFDKNDYEFVITFREGRLSGDIEGDTVTIIDQAYLGVSKTDATGQNELAGAHMRVLDKNGKLIDEWTSTTEQHKLYNLIDGQVYEIVEDYAPDGYVPLSTSIFFRRTEDGKVETLNCTNTTDRANMTCEVMSKEDILKIKNDVTSLKILKIDKSTGKALAGAKLQVLHEDGSPVYQDGKILEWTTTDEPKYLKMLPMGKYKIVEIYSPSGYVAVNNEVYFEIKADTKEQTVTFENDVTKVDISKVDITTGKEMEGAKLQILNEDRTPVYQNGELVEWTSGEDGKDENGNIKTHRINALPVGKYILIETYSPEGYFAVKNEVPFEVKAETGVQKVTFENDTTKLEISKIDITNGQEMEGARLQILHEDGTPVYQNGELLSWESKKEPKKINALPVGKYKLIETYSPEGYVAVNKEVLFEVKAETGIQTVKFENDVTKVDISKIDITTGKEMEGAKLQVLHEDGTPVYQNGELVEWTSGKDGKDANGNLKPHRIEMLPVGKYKLVETTSPEGYAAVKKEVLFEVKENAEIQKVTFENDVTKVEISKIDITNGQEMEGARLQILHEDGTPVYQNGELLAWESKAEPHRIDMLPVGKYKLVETFSPEGYIAVNNEVLFEVKAETGIQTVKFENDVTKVVISKIDITNGEELEGAELQILHEDGTPVYQNGKLVKWTSGEDGKYADGKIKPHEIKALPVGKYKLIETFSPEGYVAVKNEVLFEVKAETGIQTVKFENDVTKLEISKIDMSNSKEMEGAKLQILHEDGTPVYQNGELVEWISGTDGKDENGNLKPHKIEALPVGKYKLVETFSPEGYVAVNKEVLFEVKAESGIQKVTFENDVTKLEISKVNIATGEEMEGAKLQIVHEDGSPVYQNGKILEWTSGEDGKDENGHIKTHKIEALPVGKYKLIEIFSPEGYAAVQKEVLFEVKPERGIQKVTFENDVTKVMISKVDITNQQEMEGAELQILHADGSPVYQNGELLKWTSGKDGKDENGNLKPHYIEMLPVGEYKLIETFSPEGYAPVKNEVYFEVKPETGIQNVKFENDVTKVMISKVDITHQQEMEGAELQILHTDGTPVYQNGELLKWTSGKDGKDENGNLKPHYIEMLPAGEYKLIETFSPEGYAPVKNEVYFEVKPETGIQTVRFENDVTKVMISKVDITNQQEMEGAELQILHTDGTPVYQNGEILKWISGKDGKDENGNLKPHYIEMLPVGEYKLVETFSPEGYVAVSNEVYFEVKPETGIQNVRFENDVTKVVISKKDFTTGNELPGAKLQILHADHTPVYQDGQILEWVSDDKPHEIKKLPIGDYILVETIYPEGYQPGMIVDGIVTSEYNFTVKDRMTVKIDVFNESIKKVPSTASSATPTYVLGSMIALAGVGTITFAKKKNKEEM